MADQISRGELRVLYCPTGEMVADFFTKPLQGALFWCMRNAILNIPDEDDPGLLRASPSTKTLNGGPETGTTPTWDHRSVLKHTVGGRTYASVAKGSFE